MTKKKKIITNKGYVYLKDDLLEKVKRFPGFKLNNAQTMILFPHITANQIKYMTSPRCKHNDRIPMAGRLGNKPFFTYNQVFAWDMKDRSKNIGIKNKGGANRTNEHGIVKVRFPKK